MRWFKHYSDAKTSDGLSRLVIDLGFEGYGRYWALLEFLAFKFDGKNTVFKFHPSIVREALRFRSSKGLRTFTERLGNVRGMIVELSPNEIIFDAPILLELMGKDFKHTRAKREQNEPKKKIKIKSKDKEEDKDINVPNVSKLTGSIPDLSGNSVIEDLLTGITISVQKKWLACYQDKKFVCDELLKASIWLETNPTKRPKKNMASFLSRWLSRGWENHRKTIPSKTNRYGRESAQEKQDRILNMENPYHANGN